jgi:hypothetical protein
VQTLRGILSKAERKMGDDETPEDPEHKITE